MTLVSEVRVGVAEPGQVIDAICEHFVEHDAKITRTAKGGEAAFSIGRTVMKTDGRELVFRVEATDMGYLDLMRAGVAYHLEEFVGPGTVPNLVWVGDGCETRTPAYFRELKVVGASNVTPHMRRVTLSGERLDRFNLGGLHVRLLIPPPPEKNGGREPVWPGFGVNGILIWPQGPDALTLRTYTIRAIDVEAGTMDFDVVLHGDETAGSRWASHCQPGDVVGILGPGGGEVPDADWVLLAGDETALPAIARILEDMPPTTKGRAFIEVANEAEEQRLANATQIELMWLHRDGAEPGTTHLLEAAVRSVDWPTDGKAFAWTASEFSAFKSLRRYFRNELELTKTQHSCVAYWRRGTSEDDFAGKPVD